MQIVQSYKTKLVKPDFKNDIINTINIYRNAVSYIIDVVNYNYEKLLTYVGKNQKTYVEKLIHSTKNNIASFDFDKKFIKFPSYLRRSAIQDAIGIVSSYRSNLENYEKEKYETISNGRKFKKKPPKLSIKHFSLIKYDGTVLKRLFINQKRNKDYQNILINRLKLKQKQGGKYAANKSLWAKINGLNTQIVNDTVNKIINFAKENKANVLVFEYLDFN